MKHQPNNRWFANYSIWLPLYAYLIIIGTTQSAIAEIQITDSHGKYNFSEPPKRVVALNWALAEQMLELGETPLGIADIDGFRQHAATPIIPESVIDVGERLSPNLATIRQLRPDIILIGYSQRPLLRPLSNIATVIYFKNFGNRYNNFEKSRERFLEMAKLFDKTKLAKRKLLEADKRFTTMKHELAHVFPKGTLPALQITIPQNPVEVEKGKPIWVFGKNSLPFYAAQQLGLAVVSPDKTNQFGTAQVSPDELTTLHRDKDQTLCHAYLSSYQVPSRSETTTKPASGCSFTLSGQSAFGGIMSVLYLSEAMHQALLNLKPHH